MRAWLPPFLYALLILAGSSIPSSAVPDAAIFRADKLLHFTQYALFGALIYRALHLGTGFSSLVCAVSAASAAALFGGLDELYQRLTPGRHSSVWDVAADAAGGVVGVVLAWSWYRRNPSGDDSRLRRQEADGGGGHLRLRDGGARR